MTHDSFHAADHNVLIFPSRHFQYLLPDSGLPSSGCIFLHFDLTLVCYEKEKHYLKNPQQQQTQQSHTGLLEKMSGFPGNN